MSSDAQCPPGQALNEDGKAAVAKGELELARKTFLRGARLGHAGAQYNYGAMCLFGDGGRRDNPEAARWFRKAAEQGHEAAQGNLAGMQVAGMTEPADNAEGHQAILCAANSGDAVAQFNAGGLCVSGGDTTVDLVEAYKWFALAAAQGLAVAAARLLEIGVLLDSGERAEAHRRIRAFRVRRG